MKKSTKILLGTVVTIVTGVGIYYLVKKAGVDAESVVEELAETIVEVSEPVVETVSELSK